MLLRSRIILIVSLSFAVLVAGVLWASARREELAEERYSDAVVSGQEALWRKIAEGLIGRMETAGQGVFEEIRVLRLVERQDIDPLSAELRLIHQQLEGERLISRLEVAGPDGRLLFSSLQSGPFPTPTFDAGLMDAIVRDGRVVRGIQQDASRIYTAAVGFPLLRGDRVVGAATLAIDIDRVLAEFKASTGAEAMLLDLRGKPVVGTNLELWEALKGASSLRRSAVAMAEHDGRIYSLAGVPITDSSFRRLATLATISDITATEQRQRRVSRAFGILGIAFMIALLGGIYWYLRRSFAPLDDAIGVLKALSRGDTSVELEGARRADEIGRIAESIEVFRDHAILLEDMRISREKQRRRQERFIRQQMVALADTLDEGPRLSVLEDLSRLESHARDADEPAPGAGALRLSDDFGPLAAAFENMSVRVREQYSKLDALVAELREALKAKMAFIGLRQELEIAKRMQMSILPRALPARPDIEIVGTMLTAKEVGGDFYDFFAVDERRIGVVIADVSGKGVPAAFFMAISRTLLKATALFDIRPGACMAKLNDLLAAENEEMMFVTVFYGVLNTETGGFTYANGGHCPPVLLRADASPRELENTGGMALAVMDGQDFAERTITLAPGDSVFLYTDGVTEAFDIDGNEFTTERLLPVLAELGGCAARETAERAVAAVKAFERGADQADDITCLVLKYHGAAEPSAESIPATDAAAAPPALEAAALSCQDGAVTDAPTSAAAGGPGRVLELRLRNQLPEIHRFAAAVEEFAEQNRLSPELVFQLNLAADELLTNVISYAYDDEGGHEILVRLDLTGGVLTLAIEDDGRAFDPLAREAPDLDAALEDKPIGGLGIHFVKTMMDSVVYARENDRNRLTMTKRIEAA